MKEMNVIRQTDPMMYLPGMEEIDSTMMEQVLSAASGYDPTAVTKAQVKQALQAEELSPAGLEALLSPAADASLEEMAGKARWETKKHFGNAITLFTPLYIANYCENHCIYCGFHCKNKIKRGKLTLPEIEKEMKVISSTGLEEILLLTGESRNTSDVAYIGQAVQLARRYFSTIGIEIYPLNTEEYRFIKECGADFVSVYQETYDPIVYEKNHLEGPKRIFPYRFYAQERALRGGMRGVAFGCLLGLGDFRRDAYAAALHASLIQKKYPQAEISFSFPRIRPTINGNTGQGNAVHERQLFQIMAAYRLFMPFAGLTISTRERAGFRDQVAGMLATKMSAGVSVGVGGHEEESKGDEQFTISDDRSTAQVKSALVAKGLQPVLTDYVALG